MIIATVTVISMLLLGGGNFSFEKYFNSFVKNVVEDKSRREQILDLTKKADKQLDQYRKEVKKVLSKDIKMVFKNFDATEEDYRNAMARADQSRIAVQKSIIELRLRIKDLMTEEEWNAMYELIRKKKAEEKSKMEKKEKRETSRSTWTKAVPAT
jgi:D-mannonate dehydratase